MRHQRPCRPSEQGRWCRADSRSVITVRRGLASLRVRIGRYHDWLGCCHFRDQFLFRFRPEQSPASPFAGYFRQKVAVSVAVELDHGSTRLAALLAGRHHGHDGRAVLSTLDLEDMTVTQLVHAIVTSGEGLRPDVESERNRGVILDLRQQSKGAQGGAEAKSNSGANDRAFHWNFLFCLTV